MRTTKISSADKMDPYSALQLITPVSSKCVIVARCVGQRDAKVTRSSAGILELVYLTFSFLVSSSVFSTSLVQYIWF